MKHHVNLRYAISFAVAIAALQGSVVLSEDVDLRLDVEGSIQPRPTWRDEDNRIIYSLTFKFNDISNPTNPRINIDSQMKIAKLVDTGKLLWISVEFFRPKDCRIGEGRVSDDHVYLIHNMHTHMRDAAINIWQYRSNEFKIRFSAEGAYGALSGAVVCKSPGMLRYTYD